jgi:hypothetical protein
VKLGDSKDLKEKKKEKIRIIKEKIKTKKRNKKRHTFNAKHHKTGRT